jgi:hypothetical protein
MLLFSLGAADASKRRALYCEGIFDNSYSPATMLADAHEIAASGFDTVILAFLHYHTDGSLYYNNIEFSAATQLPQVMSILKASNSSVKSVLLSIGGSGNSADYTAIQSQWPAFNVSLVALMKKFGLNGIDLDLEDSVAPYNSALHSLAALAQEQKWLLSIPPIDCNDWIHILNTTRRANGDFGVDFLNLQSYGDGVLSYQECIQTLEGAFGDSVPNIVLSGTDIDSMPAAPDITAMLKSIHSAYPSIPGAFIWDYRLIKYIDNTGYNTRQYAAAISAGLGMHTHLRG